MFSSEVGRRAFLRAAGAALAGVPLIGRMGQAGRGAFGSQIAMSDELSSLRGATAWINGPALTESQLKGKVVLVQFWTFTCINWLRTLPYTRAWYEAYRDSGLVVIGPHTPEFGFEGKLENVERMTKELGVSYPVAVDTDYAIWRGFNNQYWPALYLIDAKGKIRHQQFGEGGFAESEQMIQKLLRETGAVINREIVAVPGTGIEVAADWKQLQSPENYLGAERTANFVSARGAGKSYVIPDALRLNQWALDGEWTVNPGAIALKRGTGRIACRFHSRDMHIVMGPPNGAHPVRFRVLLDGQGVGAAHGADVDAQGQGVATEQRLYQLIRQSGAIVDRTVTIEFLDPGVEGYSFTFG